MPQRTLVGVLLFALLRGQQTSNAVAILEKTRDTYHSLRSIQTEGITVTELRGTTVQSKTEDHFDAAFVAPAKLHVETKNGVTDVLFVSDGQTGVLYSPLTKTYTKVDLAKLKKPPSNSGEEEHNSAEGLVGATGMVFDLFQSAILAGLKNAKVTNEEEIEFEGKRVSCWVIQAEYSYSNNSKPEPFVRTYWIEKKRNVVLRERLEKKLGSTEFNLGDMQTTSTVTRLTLNEPIPDRFFVFEPPEGAKETGPSQPQTFR